MYLKSITYLVIACVVFLSCTDDRILENDDFQIAPTFEANVFQTEYTAELINNGNDSLLGPNVIRDFIDVDFFNEQVNDDYLETLVFKFRAENTINRDQILEFVFFDDMNVETFRITQTIDAGNASSPTLRFSVNLDSSEIDAITSSIQAEISISQPSTASVPGNMQLECILKAGYLYTGG